MTWSVWLIGFVILAIWIIVPIKEFGEMRRRMKEKSKEAVKDSTAP
jgi:hypothetical protein